MIARRCVGCEQQFTPGRRGGFLCDQCKKEIREEAERIKADPLHRWEKYVRKDK